MSGWLYIFSVVPLVLFVPNGAFWLHPMSLAQRHRVLSGNVECFSMFQWSLSIVQPILFIFSPFFSFLFWKSAKVKLNVARAKPLQAQERDKEVSAAELERLKAVIAHVFALYHACVDMPRWHFSADFSRSYCTICMFFWFIHFFLKMYPNWRCWRRPIDS